MATTNENIAAFVQIFYEGNVESHKHDDFPKFEGNRRSIDRVMYVYEKSEISPLGKVTMIVSKRSR